MYIEPCSELLSVLYKILRLGRFAPSLRMTEGEKGLSAFFSVTLSGAANYM